MLGRDQFTLLLGRRYNRAKKAAGGRADRDFSGAQIDPPKTADRLAIEHGVSPATVKRAGRKKAPSCGAVIRNAATVTFALAVLPACD